MSQCCNSFSDPSCTTEATNRRAAATTASRCQPSIAFGGDPPSGDDKLAVANCIRRLLVVRRMVSSIAATCSDAREYRGEVRRADSCRPASDGGSCLRSAMQHHHLLSPSLKACVYRIQQLAIASRMYSVFTKLVQERSIVKVGSMVARRQCLFKNGGNVDELDKHFDMRGIVIRR